MRVKGCSFDQRYDPFVGAVVRSVQAEQVKFSGMVTIDVVVRMV